MRQCIRYVFCTAVLASCSQSLLADDWPETQGRGRLNVWKEDGILDRFPEGGLTGRWRTPIRSGYAGPAVSAGRVFVADYEKAGEAQVERVLCLDEQSGKVLWTFEIHALLLKRERVDENLEEFTWHLNRFGHFVSPFFVSVAQRSGSDCERSELVCGRWLGPFVLLRLLQVVNVAHRA